MKYNFDKVYKKIEERREAQNRITRVAAKSSVAGYNKYRTHIKEGHRGGYGTGLFKTSRSNLNKLLR